MASETGGETLFQRGSLTLTTTHITIGGKTYNLWDVYSIGYGRPPRRPWLAWVLLAAAAAALAASLAWQSPLLAGLALLAALPGAAWLWRARPQPIVRVTFDDGFAATFTARDAAELAKLKSLLSAAIAGRK
jgi:hypothetical protein